MKNNKILNEANEALKRTLLMMNYDMKKTLTENVEVISEQENVGGNPEDQQIAIKFRNAVMGAGTEESVIEDSLNLIKDKTQFDRVNSLIPKYTTYKNIQDALNGEYETDNLDDVLKIKDILLKKGVNLTYKTYVDRQSGDLRYKYKSIVLSDGNTTPDTNTLSSTTSSSLDNLKKLVKGEDSNVNKLPSFKVKYPNSIIQFANNGRFFQYSSDGKSLSKKGTWKIENGKIVKTYDGASGTSSTKKSVPAITDKNLLSTLNFEYKFPGDNTYVYDFVPSGTMTEETNKGGTWYAKNLKTGKVFNISQNYPQTEKKLNTEFPSAANPIDKSPKDLSTEPVEPALPEPPPAPDLNAAAGLEPPKLQNDMKNVQKESLKKSLKKNLMEVRENKKNLMVETNIVEKRFKFIVEGKTFETETEQDFLIESVISEIGYLKAQGYTPKAINEGLFSMLGSLLGGAATSAPAVFGEYIAGWLTKQLGIPQNSYMNGVIVSLVGNLNIADYDRFFSDCRFASNKVADSLIEGYLLQLQNEKNVNSGASGFIVSALRNSVVDYFAEDKNSLIQILEDKIGEFICPKLSKLSSVIGDKAEDIKAKAVA
jgi:hypothetical protein